MAFINTMMYRNRRLVHHWVFLNVKGLESEGNKDADNFLP